MNISKTLNRVKTLPGLFITLIVAALLSLITASAVIGSQPVTMEGNVESLNASKGETTYTDSTALEVNEVAQIQLWHHNREAPNTLSATNTVVRFEVPTEEGKTQVVRGVSSSDNGNTISDTTNINLPHDRSRLEYLPGTAKFKYNKGAVDGRVECITGYDYPPQDCFATVTISDDVINGGVNLDAIRGGPLEGCNAYHETITIQVRSVIDVVTVNKYVRHYGEDASAWSTHTDAQPGDRLEYLIRFENEGNTTLNDVMVGDNLPQYNRYLDGTTMLSNGNHPNGISISNDNITRGGINVGNYTPGAVAFVWFSVELDPITAYERCGTYEVVNVGVVRPAGMNEFYNTASVDIDVECTEQPVVTCDQLTAPTLMPNLGEEVIFTADATASGGATIDGYIFTVDGNVVQDSDSKTYPYVADQVGQFEVAVTVKSSEGNRTSAACTAIVDPQDNRIVTCDQLVPSQLTLNVGDSATLVAEATASGGAQIEEYAFTINDLLAQISDSNEFLVVAGEPGTYNIAVIVISNIGEHTSEACTATITVVEEDDPIYACEEFTLSRNKIKEGQTITVSVNVLAENGAEFKFATIGFGDEASDSDKLVTNTIKNGVVTANHTYKKAGNYKVTVDLTFNVNGEMVTTGANCMGEVEVEDTPVCEVPGKEHLPVGHKDCVIPDTGAGSIAGAFAALTAAGTAAHRKLTLRRG